MFYHRFYSRGLKILMAYLFVGLMFVSINFYSAFDAFSCVVKQAQFVSNDGLLVDQARYQYLVAQCGQEYRRNCRGLHNGQYKKAASDHRLWF